MRAKKKQIKKLTRESEEKEFSEQLKRGKKFDNNILDLTIEYEALQDRLHELRKAIVFSSLSRDFDPLYDGYIDNLGSEDRMIAKSLFGQYFDAKNGHSFIFSFGEENKKVGFYLVCFKNGKKYLKLGPLPIVSMLKFFLEELEEELELYLHGKKLLIKARKKNKFGKKTWRLSIEEEIASNPSQLKILELSFARKKLTKLTVKERDKTEFFNKKILQFKNIRKNNSNFFYQDLRKLSTCQKLHVLAGL